jgi:hypothetical protein
MLDPVYDIKFRIGDTELSKNIYDIEIASSINFVLHGLIIKLKIDSIDIFRNKIFGQDSGSLDIILSTVDKTIHEKISIDLIITNVGFDVSMKSTSNEDHSQSESLQIHAVPKKSFEKMYTTVSKLIKSGTNLSPIEALRSIISKFINGSDVVIDPRFSNKTPIYQLHIPPMSLCKCINIIDSKYPLYNGILFRFCDIDGKLRISNLNTLISDAPLYNIFILTKGEISDDNDDILKTVITEKNYFTTSKISTRYSNNSQLFKSGFTRKYNLTKKTELMTTATIDSDLIFNKYLPKSNKKSQIYDKSISNKRLTVNNSLMGEDSTKLPINNMSSNLGMPSQIEFTLNGNLPLTDLLKVGIPLELKTNIPSYQEYIGKYVVIMSDVKLRKTNGSYFSSLVTIKCARSNY